MESGRSIELSSTLFTPIGGATLERRTACTHSNRGKHGSNTYTMHEEIYPIALSLYMRTHTS